MSQFVAAEASPHDDNAPGPETWGVAHSREAPVITEATTVQDVDEALTHMAHEWREAGETRRVVLGAYIDGLLDKRLALGG